MYWRYFYPRHPRGWRPQIAQPSRGTHRISIHATLAGGDKVACPSASLASLFLSTPPSRVATKTAGGPARWILTFLSTPPSRVATGHRGGSRAPSGISIHATLAGGDVVEISSGSTAHLFLSTPPSRVATSSAPKYCSSKKISIHATLAGGDGCTSGSTALTGHFYPRHPRGWRLLFLHL